MVPMLLLRFARDGLARILFDQNRRYLVQQADRTYLGNYYKSSFVSVPEIAPTVSVDLLITTSYMPTFRY
jgi:hypothetical protein